MKSKFQPIFDYIDEQTALLRSEMATKKDIQAIITAIDAFAKEAKDNRQERVFHENKVTKIENWVVTAAEKIEVPYNQ